jgi:hypothetical protein
MPQSFRCSPAATSYLASSSDTSTGQTAVAVPGAHPSQAPSNSPRLIPFTDRLYDTQFHELGYTMPHGDLY